MMGLIKVFQLQNAVLYSSRSCLPLRSARHWQMPKGSCPAASPSNMAPLGGAFLLQ